jgi:hypothetical protein
MEGVQQDPEVDGFDRSKQDMQLVPDKSFGITFGRPLHPFGVHSVLIW